MFDDSKSVTKCIFSSDPLFYILGDLISSVQKSRIIDHRFTSAPRPLLPSRSPLEPFHLYQFISCSWFIELLPFPLVQHCHESIARLTRDGDPVTVKPCERQLGARL